MESVEIDRNSGLKQAVMKITEALTKKFKLKQEELLDLISEKEKVVNEIEGKAEFKGTVLEDYLINYRLGSPKKSIRYYNIGNVGKANNSQFYIGLGSSKKRKSEKNLHTEDSEVSLKNFRFNSERSEENKDDLDILREQIRNGELKGHERRDIEEDEDEGLDYFEYNDKMVDDLNNFNFDITRFVKEKQKMRIKSIYTMFDSAGMVDQFEVDKPKLLNYIRKAEFYYERNNNPYHNFEHGITVLHCCYYFLQNIPNISQYFKSELSRAALLFASFMHDVDHTGKNNAFMIKAMTPMARRYNDQHVLENHHCATAFKYLMKKGTDFLSKMSRGDFILFRKYVIHGIIKTDMAEHTSMVKTISFKVEKEDSFNPDEEENPSNFLDLFSLVMHTADLYTPSKKYKISSKWADRINKEMLNQLEHERKLDLPVTTFYVGLDQIDIRAKSEGFFIEKIVYPLWSLLDTIFEGGLEEQLKQMKENRNNWKKIQEGKEVKTAREKKR